MVKKMVDLGGGRGKGTVKEKGGESYSKALM